MMTYGGRCGEMPVCRLSPCRGGLMSDILRDACSAVKGHILDLNLIARQSMRMVLGAQLMKPELPGRADD